ncbi:2,3-bisphosphoglycerate-independent phosphoglycerate mutase [Desulfosalsimonas propionicica]|uniref:2,3-bisphosphoglycerate-independent phosphoglycerate mutase n=1 Tax=Desulfosalsimonas propionicica TaxID=332175 RepID=A0A7W0C5R1_9BACT|nr:alkaline phosphatase family protein [Desulfosalsimonas propionicica]MBA2879705.1 2,3-bisphosphoglycerate-independent phosphoglycerate mutase [Desulfosalsimonas propionicica]
MKVILVLLDGLGDRTYARLGHKTPLAAARTPSLDRIAAIGANGTYHALSPGRCLPSEMAHFLMFGYTLADFPGRGLLEAAGEKVPFADSEVLVLAHLCRVGIDSNQRAFLEQGRDDIVGDRDFLSRFYKQISAYEYKNIGFRLHQTGRNDAILAISGHVSPDISDSDPVLRKSPIARIMPLARTKEPDRAAKTADTLNHYLAWCADRLKDLDAAPGAPGPALNPNFLVTQRSGRKKPIAGFGDKWGFSPAMIASGGVYQGLATELGFDFTRVRNSANPGKDMAERIQTAIDDPDHDFIHVHTKAPDQVSHRESPERKADVISALDTGFAGLLNMLETKEKDILAVVTADHSTPSDAKLIHSGETVPLAMAGGAIRKDPVHRFDEIAATAGSLGQLRGADLMHMILNSTDRAMLQGLCLGAHKRAYRPENYPAFTMKKQKGSRQLS